MMEISSAPQPPKGLADDSPWSPTTSRPTVNTSALSNHLPSTTPSDQSPIPSSSLSPSSQHSPWIQPLSLSSSDQSNPFSFTPRQGPPSPDLLSSGNQSPMFPNSSSNNNDWANIFSAPLNPAMFAQLAANGIINPLNSVPPSSATASNARFNPSQSSRVRDGSSRGHRQSLPGVYPGQQPPVGPSYSKRSSAQQSSKAKSHSLGFTPIMSHGPASRGNPLVEGKSPTSGGHSRHTSSGMSEN